MDCDTLNIMKQLFYLTLWAFLLIGGIRTVDKLNKKPIKKTRKEIKLISGFVPVLVSVPDGKVSSKQFERLLKKNNELKKLLHTKKLKN